MLRVIRESISNKLMLVVMATTFVALLTYGLVHWKRDRPEMALGRLSHRHGYRKKDRSEKHPSSWARILVGKSDNT